MELSYVENGKWKVIYTSSRQEKKVAAYLDKFEIEKRFAKQRIIFIFFNIMIDIAILIASIFICKSSEATN